MAHMKAAVIAADEADADALQTEAAKAGYQIVAVLTPSAPTLDPAVGAAAVVIAAGIDVYGDDTYRPIHEAAVTQVTGG